MPNLDEMLKRVIAEKGSDPHLIAGDPPRMRRFGELAAIDETRLEAQATRELLYGIMPARIRAHFEQYDDADFALT